MVEIKAGAELDLAVAEACGVSGWIESLRNEATGYESPGRFALENVFWEPSVDLNAAFAAAEKAGLFDVHWLGKLRTGWVVHEMDTGPISECETASLAICAAILALAKVNHAGESWVRSCRSKDHGM